MNDFEIERQNVGPGWQSLIEQLHIDLLNIDPNYTIDQIKEKFGGLRYYMTPSRSEPEIQERMTALISRAEVAADQTCEECGAPGHPRWNRRWVKTLCDRHA